MKMYNGIVRILRGARYIPKMMRNQISLRRLKMKGYTIKTESHGVLKAANECLVPLNKVMGNNSHVLLRIGESW